MTFTFPRLSAGIYEVQKDSNTVGFIRKASAAKWIVTDVVDTPQHVTKTLKDAKDACINLIIFEVLDKTPEPEYNDSVGVDKVNTELNEVVKGSLRTYRQIPGTDEFEEVSPSEFGFAEPTLEPIEF
jgi:ATP-dependent 26S proteasome regulatory subunit